MTNKHTHGPWIISEDSIGFVYALNDLCHNRFWLNVSNGDISRRERTSDEEINANARLISAAPELLKSLVLLHDRLALNNDSGAYSDLIWNARSAIAKATGA